MIRAVMFDFGHTIMDELKDRDVPLRSRAVRLMPGVLEALAGIPLAMGIWANTRSSEESAIRDWLRRGQIADYFQWIVTSIAAGYRKPDKRFFEFALKLCGLEKEDVLFVGNQLNTDIRGATEYGIQNVWLSGPAYQSPDDTPAPGDIDPTYSIEHLQDLPRLVAKVNQ